MKILWIGDYINRETARWLEKNGEKLLSGYVSTTSIVEGLDQWSIDMDTINSYLLSNQRIKVFPEVRWSRNGTSVDVNVGYRNIKYFQHLLRTHALKSEVRKWVKNRYCNDNLVIIVNNYHSPYLKAALLAKSIIHDAKIVLIIPDLPQYMELSVSPLKKLLKRIDWIFLKRAQIKIDKYVLYSKTMAEYLGIVDKPWIVMEGLYEGDYYQRQIPVRNDVVSVMYSGALDLRYGIPELLEAVDRLGEGYELWLTGRGNALNLIGEYSKRNPRIKMIGYIDSREELHKIQQSATMLINPRRNSEIASKYCFPSKLFEYLVSGRPTISCYLDGIPVEYYQYLVELKSVTPEEIMNAIKHVVDLGETEQKNLGEKARSFVLENKTKKVQAGKILSFISYKEE